MKRTYLVLPLLALALGVGACAPVKSPAPDCTTSPNLAAENFVAVNADRRTHGSPEVRWNQELADFATAWSYHMAAHGLDHSPSPPRTSFENVMGPGFCVTNGNVVNRLFEQRHPETKHWANILDSDHREVGIGWTLDAQGRLWLTQEFR